MIHQITGKVGASDTSRAVRQECETDLQVVEVEASLEQGSCGRCYHTPYSVDNAAEEEGDEDVFLEEKLQWGDDALNGELLLGSRIAVDLRII